MPWGNPGATITSTIAAAAFNELVGGQGFGVPYSGSAPTLNALLGGHVGFMFNAVENVKGHVDKGALVALATLGKQRMPGLESVPTMAEAGLPEMMNLCPWEFWYGAAAPAGTPPELVTAMNNALHQAGVDAETRERFQKMSLRMLPRATAEESDRTVAQEVEQYRPFILKVAGKK